MSNVNPLSNFAYNSLVLQRTLGINQNLLNRTIERLTTGLRINRAADDPLGITLARRAQTKLVSNRQAADNTQQSITLADTAANSVQGVVSNLQRMRELILESISDTASSTDRSRIQSEINKLVENTDYLSRQSIFNTRQLLDGSLTDFVLPSAASGDIVYNASLKDASGTAFDFLTGAPTIDPDTSAFDSVQFRIFANGSGGYGLEVSTANAGVALTYNDITTAPTAVSLTAGGATASFNVAAITGGTAGVSGPLSSTELDQSIGSLVASGRLNSVNYGALNLSLGGTAFNNLIDVQSSTTLNQVLTAIQGATSGVSATYNSGAGTFSVSYSNTASATTTRTSAYSTAGTPSSVGGPYSSFASLNPAAQGPNYPDITSFLPTGSFDPDSLPGGTYFAASGDIPLDTSVSYTGSGANLLSFFGLSNTVNNYQITDYNTEFYGDVLSVGADYSNRTRVVITDVTGEQSQTGTQDTGLSATDLTRSLGELSTPYVSLTSGATSLPDFTAGGPFTIDFGSNGVFSYNFDPDTDTIQSVIDAVNAFGVTVNTADSTANVTASFNATTGQVTISNDPPDGATSGLGIVENTEIENSQLKLAFGSKSSDIVTVNNPSDLTIDELVTEINLQLNKAMGTSGVVVASFSYASLDDRLSFDLSQYTTSTAFGDHVEFDLSGATGPDGEPNGYDIADFFNLIPEGTTAADFNAAGGVINAPAVGGIVTSISDIDNSADVSATDPREITASIYLSYSLADLSAGISTPANNSITFGSNATSTALQDFFNIANVADTGTGVSQSTISSTDIDNGATYSGLNVTNPSSLTFTELLTAPSPTLQGLSGLVGQTLRIDGTDVITVASTSTIQNIIDAINGYNNGAAPSNKDYEASFASGRLSINVVDTANLSNPASQAAANPSGATPTVNGNTLTLDSATYAFSGNPAPTAFGPSATAPGVGDTPYLYTTPTAPADISSISFGGATNLASVLLLGNAINASTTAGTPTVTSDSYSGSFSGTSPNFTLTGSQTRNFAATSTTNSSGAIGNTTGTGSAINLDLTSLPSNGVVAEVAISPAILGRFENRGLVFQIGGEEGNTLNFNINELTADSLHLEGLSTFRSGDSDALARLRGNNALRTVDAAIEQSLDVLNQVGIYQRLLESNLDYLGNKQITMSQYLSDLQDADVAEETMNLTKAQVTAQVGAALFAQNSANTSSLYGLLFGSSGGSFGS